MTLPNKFRHWLLWPVLDEIHNLRTLMSETSNKIDALTDKLRQDFQDLKDMLSKPDPDVDAAIARLSELEQALDAETP